MLPRDSFITVILPALYFRHIKRPLRPTHYLYPESARLTVYARRGFESIAEAISSQEKVLFLRYTL